MSTNDYLTTMFIAAATERARVFCRRSKRCFKAIFKCNACATFDFANQLLAEEVSFPCSRRGWGEVG